MKLNVAIFVDPLCPFSLKLTKTLRQMPTTLPEVNSVAGEVNVRYSVVLNLQPWHVCSSLVARLVAVSAKLEQYDGMLRTLEWIGERRGDVEPAAHVPTFDESACAQKLQADWLDAHPAIRDEAVRLLGADGDSFVEQFLKEHARRSRSLGVHATPTVFVEGIEAKGVSSSMTVDEFTAELKSLAEARLPYTISSS